MYSVPVMVHSEDYCPVIEQCLGYTVCMHMWKDVIDFDQFHIHMHVVQHITII